MKDSWNLRALIGLCRIEMVVTDNRQLGIQNALIGLCRIEIPL